MGTNQKRRGNFIKSPVHTNMRKVIAMKYAYPAVFQRDGDLYSVYFPDVEGCYTSGESLADAMEMASDALCLMLFDLEESGQKVPVPSDVKVLQESTSDLVSLVFCDTLDYRRFYNNQAVKKTLSIPAWLNAAAQEHNVNFSQVLQDALKAQLGLL